MKRLICLTPIAFLAFMGLVTGIAAENQHQDEVFFRANQAYKEGHFQEAVNGYCQLIRSGHATGHLFYNLGNAYFRVKQLGRAICYYERARLLIPRDADLNFNLNYARDQTQDAIPEARGFMKIIFFWLESLNLHELFQGFAVLNILFWAVLAIRLFFWPEWIYYLFLAVLIFWLITGASFGLKWYQAESDDRAVIVHDEVDVLAGPDIRDTVLCKLHAGTIIHAERSEDAWYLVRLPDKKRGWVMADSIERILPLPAMSLAVQRRRLDRKSL